MNKGRKRSRKPSDYPNRTMGSELAAEARRMSNSLTEEQRADYFKQAMAMIYGSRETKTTVRSRR